VTIGLALSAGAARGFAHIGVLYALEQARIPIHQIAGASFGALIGASYASGISAEELIERATSNEIKRLGVLLSLTVQRTGLVRESRISRFIRLFLDKDDFEELLIPVTIVATRVDTGEEIHLSSGDLYKAIRASIAFPVAITPVRHNGYYLMDGGLVNPVPVNALSTDIKIACNVLPHPKSKKRIQRIVISDVSLHSRLRRLKKYLCESIKETFIDRFINLKIAVTSPMLANLFVHREVVIENTIINLHYKLTPPDFVINPKVEHIGQTQFYRAKEAIKAGWEAAQPVISEIKKLLCEKV